MKALLLSYTPPENRIPLGAFPHVIPARRASVRPRLLPKLRMFCVSGGAKHKGGVMCIARVITTPFGASDAISRIRKHIRPEFPGLRFKLAAFEVSLEIMRQVVYTHEAAK